MRVWSPEGAAYDGEPVDCRELMLGNGYTKTPPPGAELPPPPPISADAAGKRAELVAYLDKLPVAIAAGELADPDYVVTQMRGRYGELFGADHEAEIRELFAIAAAGKAAEQGQGVPETGQGASEPAGDVGQDAGAPETAKDDGKTKPAKGKGKG